MTRFGATSAALALSLAVSGAAFGQAQQQGSDAGMFINQMAIAGMAEVQLGMMASERAANADVKAFGQMMVTDHTKANNELKDVASKMKVELPKKLDAKHQELVDRLSKLNGAAFDREYMNAMVPGHEEVASQLRTWAGNRLTSNAPGGAGKPAPAGSSTVGTSGSADSTAAVRQWASKTLPTVQHHLEEARALQSKVK
jgi:putative membrane protein